MTRPPGRPRLPKLEHDHQWQPLDVTEVIGSIRFDMDHCQIRGCHCRRARRAVEDDKPAEDRAG